MICITENSKEKIKQMSKERDARKKTIFPDVGKFKMEGLRSNSNKVFRPVMIKHVLLDEENDVLLYLQKVRLIVCFLNSASSLRDFLFSQLPIFV